LLLPTISQKEIAMKPLLQKTHIHYDWKMIGRVFPSWKDIGIYTPSVDFYLRCSGHKDMVYTVVGASGLIYIIIIERTSYCIYLVLRQSIGIFDVRTADH